jgi:guanylate kinase
VSALVILSGPSGVGKDTLLAEWTKINPDVHRVVAYTTRPIRPGETDGVDYRFVDEERFMRKADAGEFLEWKEVHGNLYATPLSDMEELLRRGKIAVLKIDVQGALQAMALRPEALSVFIKPPSWDELERRIRDRRLDTAEQIQRRLENAQGEMALADRYKFQIVNDDLTKAALQLDTVIRSAIGEDVR